MSNALVTLNGAGALTPLQEAILQEMDSEQNAFDYIPTRIKFPSGDVKAFVTNDGDMLKPPFTAIIAVAQKARAWWPGKDTAGQPPLCSSPDGVQGLFNFEQDGQTYDASLLPVQHPALAHQGAAMRGPWACVECPLSQWGSGGAGRGQSCKSLRRLIVLVEGWSMPAIMTVPPTSTKIFDLYASAAARNRGQAYFTVRTKFGLDQAVSGSGVKYSVLKLEPGKPLDETEIGAVIEIRQQYAALVRSMGIDAGDYEGASASNGHAKEPYIDPATGEIIEGQAAEIPF